MEKETNTNEQQIEQIKYLQNVIEELQGRLARYENANAQLEMTIRVLASLMNR